MLNVGSCRRAEGEGAKLSLNGTPFFVQKDVDWGDPDEEVPGFAEDVERFEAAASGTDPAVKEEYTAEAVDVDSVALSMLKRAISGTPAKRLVASIVRAASKEVIFTDIRAQMWVVFIRLDP